MTPTDPPQQPGNNPPPSPGAAGPPPKRKATAAQVAASKKNSQASTGPRDTSRSRFNRVIHGMACKEHVCVGEETEEAIDQTTETFAAELGAVTAPERASVRLAVEALTRVDRCLDSDEAGTARDVNAAVEGFDGDQHRTFNELLKQFDIDPCDTVRGFRSISSGLRHLIGQVDLINNHLNMQKGLFPTQRVLFLHLTGHDPKKLFVDAVVMQWNLYYLAALLGSKATAAEAAKLFAADRPEGMLPGEFEGRLGKEMMAGLPEREGGCEMLRFMLQQTKAELSRQLEVILAREQRDRKLTAQAAQVSGNKDCMNRQRYFRENTNAYNAALRQVRQLIEFRLKHPELVGEACSEGSETGSEPVPEAGERTEAGAPEVVGGSGAGTGSAAVRPAAEAARGGAVASDGAAPRVEGGFSPGEGVRRDE